MSKIPDWMRPVTHLVSAPCSTGKTHAACLHIVENGHLTNHIYIAPSLDLLTQTATTLIGMGVKPTVITSETDPENVKRTILEYLEGAEEVGEVALVTWQAYADLPYFPRRSNWQPIIDEVPQLDDPHPWNLPRNLGFIRDRVVIGPHGPGDKLARVSPADREELAALYRGEVDDVDKLFAPFFRELLSTGRQMYVDLATWNAAIERDVDDDKASESRVYFISMLRPHLFRDAILLGANVEDSLVYRWLQKAGHLLEPFEPIVDNLRSAPEVGHRLRISFLIPGTNASKYAYNKTDESGVSVLDRMDALAVKAFGGERFLYGANNDRKSPIIDDLPNAKRMPVVAHGLNQFDTYTNIYFSPALNRERKHFEMLRQFGFASDHVHKASAHETAYQAIMRTALRRPDSAAEVHVIVADEPMARRIDGLLGSIAVSQLGDISLKSRNSYTPTQKAQRWTANKLQKAIFAPKSIPESFIYDSGIKSGAFEGILTPTSSFDSVIPFGLRPNAGAAPPRSFDEIMKPDLHQQSDVASNDAEPGNSLHCFVNFHNSIYDADPDQHLMVSGKVTDFVGIMRTFARAPIAHKDESFLFNPCRFERPEGAKGFRKKDYFRESSFLVLDFDGGNLSPETFIDIFWDKAKHGTRHSFIVCNSFSRSDAEPNKFRVVMFYKRPATTLEMHKGVLDYVLSRLAEHGFTDESAELDFMCRSGVQSFFMPCTNIHQENHRLFEARGVKERELGRCAIDPVQFSKRAGARPWRAASTSLRTGPATREESSAATAKLFSMSSGRHRVLFQTALTLARMGLARDEVRLELLQGVGGEAKMHKKVDDALASLTRYGWFTRSDRSNDDFSVGQRAA